MTGMARGLQQATLEGIGAGPCIVLGLPPCRGQAIIPSGLGVALLELRRLFLAGELDPAQPLQGGKVDDEGVIAATAALPR